MEDARRTFLLFLSVAAACGFADSLLLLLLCSSLRLVLAAANRSERDVVAEDARGRVDTPEGEPVGDPCTFFRLAIGASGVVEKFLRFVGVAKRESEVRASTPVAISRVLLVP